jgi:hypothetical protein
MNHTNGSGDSIIPPGTVKEKEYEWKVSLNVIVILSEKRTA